MPRKKKTDLAEQILTEDLLTVKDVCNEVPRPAGKGPLCYATVHRWIHNGLRGHKLETIKIGQQVVTSRQRLAAFLAATAED